MARYIDANKAQEDFEKIADEPDYMHEGETWQTGIYLAGTIIDKQPTADVVEVVRCKECKHRNPCGHKCKRDNLWHDDDDFCSYGTPKEIRTEGAG